MGNIPNSNRFANRVSADSLLAWIFLSLLVCGLLLGRKVHYLLAPGFPGDDGYFVFSHFYQLRDPFVILRHKGGYIPLLPNLIAFCSVRLPVTWAPYVFAFAALALNWLGCVFVFHKGFRWLIDTDWHRAALALLLASMPTRTFHLLFVLDYTIFNALWLALLLAIVSPPERLRTQIALFIPCLVVLVSHPVGIVVLPIFAIWLLRRPVARGWYGALTLVMLWYLYAADVTRSVPKGVVRADRETLLFIRQYFELGYTSVLRAFGFGGGVSSITAFEVLLFLIAMVLLLLLLVWKARPLFYKLLLFGYFVAAVSFAVVFARGFFFEAQPGYQHRYTYVQSMLVLFAAMCLLTTGRTLCKEVKRYTLWSSSIIALLFFWNCSQIVAPDFRAAQYHYRNGKLVGEFVRVLARRLAEDASGQGVTLIAVKEHEPAVVVLSSEDRVGALPSCLRWFIRKPGKCSPPGIYESVESLVKALPQQRIR